jgi:arsenate reductase
MLNVLFLCTGNSARSILAEALLNDPSIGQRQFRAFSAGSHPRGTVHPLALEVLAQHQIASRGFRSKNWEAFAGPDAPRMDFVFTVCDAAAGEQCPLWPGHPVTAHWSVPDPAAVTGSDAERRTAFLNAFLTLRRRIEEFVTTPRKGP